MIRLGEALFRIRLLLLVLVILSLAPAARFLPDLRSNNNVDAFLAENDPGLSFYQATTDLFGGDHLVWVALRTPPGSLFTVDGLTRLDRVTRALREVEGVDDVTSLTDTDAVLGDAGSVFVGPLLEAPPTTAEEAAGIQAKVEGSPLLRRLLAADGSSTLLVVELADEALTDPARQNRIVAALRDRLASLEPAGAFHLAGNSVVAEAIERNNNRDTRLFSGLMLLLVAVSGVVLTRRLGLGLLSVGVVLIGVTWTMGGFIAAGNQTNWVTSMITPLLVLVGVADANHLITRFMELLPSSPSRREAAWQATREMFVPCFWTSLTTAIGFYSLVFNEVLPVRVFGIWAAIGVMLTFSATFIVVPAVMALGRNLSLIHI